MGDQVYAYRGKYSTAYDSGSGGGEKVCRIAVCDSDGRQRSVYGDERAYVVEATEVVTERIRPSYSPATPYSEHRLQRRPREVEEFLSGVQIEASRPRPVAVGQNRRGNAYGGGGYSSDDCNDDDDDDNESDGDDYFHEDCHRPRPRTGKLMNPTSNIDEAVESLRVSATSRPYSASQTTNNVKPYGEVTSRPYPAQYQTTEAAVKPYRTTNNSSYSSNYGTKYRPSSPEPTTSIKPYGCTTNNDYGTKYRPSSPEPTVRPHDGTTTGSYWTKYQTSSPEPVKPYGGTANTGYGTKYQTSSPEPVKPYGGTANTGYGTKYQTTSPEPVKPYGGTVNTGYGTKYQTSSPEPVKPYSGTANTGYGTKYSEPAVKPYGGGGYGTATETATVATRSSGVIDCYEAAKRYNGKVIRT